MKHRSIQHTLSSALGLLIFLFASSCISNKEIQNPELTTVQVSSFTLTSKSNPALEKVFFSIDHAKGKIYNAQPLPYGTQIDSVKIKVGIQTPATFKLLIDGKELERSATDSIYLRDRWNKEITVEVTNKEKALKKSYKVQIQSQFHNPDSYYWMPVIAGQLPDLSGKKTIFCRSDKDLYIFASQGAQTQLYHAPANTLVWEEVTTGLSGKPVTSAIATSEGILYAILGTAPHQTCIVSLDGGKQWLEENRINNGSILLGAFTERGQTYPTLCMIEQDPSGKNYFACLPGNGAYKRGEEVPEDFPMSGHSTALFEVAHHPLLVLVGAKTASGKPSRLTWTTTTGLDWLTPTPQSDKDLLPPFEGAEAPLLISTSSNKGLLYCVYPASHTPQRRATIYSSKDQGVTWTARNAALMLPHETEPFGGYGKLFGFAKDELIFFLFGGKKADGSLDRTIWEGRSSILN